MTSSLQIPAEFSSEKNEIDEQVAKFYSYCLLYFVFFHRCFCFTDCREISIFKVTGKMTNFRPTLIV